MEMCKWKDCKNDAYCKGYCKKDYYKAKRHGLLPGAECSMVDCNVPAYRHGLCNTHNLRNERHGDPLVRKKAANGEVCNSICFVEDCNNPGKATYQNNIYCSTHHRRMGRYNDYDKILKPSKVTPEKRKLNTKNAQKTYSQTSYGRMRSRFAAAKRRILAGGTSKYISKEVFIEMWNRTNCAICGEIMTDDNKSIDHIIPVSRGGSNFMDNLQMAHLSCNQKKSNK